LHKLKIDTLPLNYSPTVRSRR